MKKLISLTSMLFLAVMSLSAQSHCGASPTCSSNEAKSNASSAASVADAMNVVVVINSATWCGVCQANGARVEHDVVMQFMNDNHFTFIKNDLSSDESKKTSQMELEKVGLPDFAKENKYTGMIYFINPETKRIVDSISVAKSNDEIIALFNKYKG